MPLPESLRRAELVAIGCSAGGFEALRKILPALPVGFDKAIAVVLHLLPDKESLVAKTFSGTTALPVKEAEDKEAVGKGTIYVAPPNYHLLAEPDGTFSLSVDELVNCSRPSIDVFFDSVAHTYGPRAVGILLTGANADGAEGLREIRRCGGFTVVEDPKSAQYPQMPTAGVEIAGPDLVLPVDQIAAWLSALPKGGVPA
jgi:two-component system chemotaxis response regulator CheB